MIDHEDARITELRRLLAEALEIRDEAAYLIVEATGFYSNWSEFETLPTFGMPKEQLNDRQTTASLVCDSDT